jgi:hypothetical protein
VCGGSVTSRSRGGLMRSAGPEKRRTRGVIVVVWWWCAPGTVDLMIRPMRCGPNGKECNPESRANAPVADFQFRVRTKWAVSRRTLASWYHEAVVPPIVRRLQSDDRLAVRLTARLSDRPSPTEKTTLPRLLALSRGMSPTLRNWCLAEIDHQVGMDGLSEIGYDLIAGANRAVWHGLMDALG